MRNLHEFNFYRSPIRGIVIAHLARYYFYRSFIVKGFQLPVYRDMRMNGTILQIVTKDKKFYSVRPDDPAKPLKPISLNAVMELLKNLHRMEHDGFNERLK